MMTYRATTDVVQRVMPLLERMATRAIDKAQLLQYLSARAGVDWGIHDLLREEVNAVTDVRGGGIHQVRQVTYRDRVTAQEYVLAYPESLARLPVEIEPLVIEEYKRLAVDRPLTMMAEPLFRFFFATDFCNQCRWHREEHGQIQMECRFAGYPVNFEPLATDPPESLSGADTQL